MDCLGQRDVSGAHAMMMAGSSPITVALSDQELSNAGKPSTYTLSSDGFATGTGMSSELWLVNGTADRAECYCQVVSGSVSGPVNSWNVLSTSRQWIGLNAQIQVSIRQVGTSTPLVTATIVFLGS
jgi:hypothetical protein